MIKRLFIGTHIDESVFKFHYDGILNDFNPVSTGKWVELHNFHFTFKFLGDTDEKLIPEILALIKEELNTFNSALIFRGLDVFPNAKRPNVLFTKIINPDKKIFAVQQTLEAKLSSLGFEKEQRRFKPHLTLRRIKSNENNFENILSFYKDLEFGEMQYFSVNLIESKLTPHGPIYKVLSQ